MRFQSDDAAYKALHPAQVIQDGNQVHPLFYGLDKKGIGIMAFCRQ